MWYSRRALLRLVLTMAIVGVGAIAVLMVLEVPLAPWARSFGLWPTLAGAWHGEVRTAEGRVSFVYLEIRGDVLRLGARGPGRSHIKGSARWCDENRRIWDYDIWGNPDNWRGTRFHLSTRSLTERESGMSLGDLQGEWSGDEIRASGVLFSVARTATAEATRTSPPQGPPTVRYTLRRGGEGEFLAACGTKR